MKERIINDIFKYGLIGCFDCHGNRIKMNKDIPSLPFLEDVPEYLLVIMPEALNYNFKYRDPYSGSIFSTLDVRQNFYKEWIPAVKHRSDFVDINNLVLKVANRHWPIISKVEHIVKLADSGHKMRCFVFKRCAFDKSYNSGSLSYIQLRDLDEKCPERIQNWYRDLIGLPVHIDYTSIANRYKSSEDHVIDSWRYSLDSYHEFCKRAQSNQKLPEIKNVIFNDPATIVFWEDGTKTVVKNDDRYKSGKLKPYDPEKGLSMAISKKALGNDGKYYNKFRKWLPKED